MFYSASLNQFYTRPEDYPTESGPFAFPADAVEITDELYNEVMLERPPEKIIVPGPDGLPMVSDPAPPSREAIEALRLQAYANPITGSDHYFAEAVRLTAQGDAKGAASVTAAGQVRYEEIRAELPWPADPVAKKAKK